MAIASNATEEHQYVKHTSLVPGMTTGAWAVMLTVDRFVFAINTISMVKNDALFSYIAPGNIFAWLLMPLRYCIPLKQFVWLNRFVIKATHFPLLFAIFFYERYWLAPSMYEPTDLVENPGRGRGRAISFADPASRAALFSPNVRVREESVAGFQKDRALEEVFRRVPDIATLRTQRRHERRKTQNAIRNWMDQADEMGASPANWPTLDGRPGPPPDFHRRYSMNRVDRPHRLRQVSDVRSAASDPADLLSNHGLVPFRSSPGFDGQRRERGHAEYKDATDADGDDELVTNDEEEEDDEEAPTSRSGRSRPKPVEEDYFTTPIATRFNTAPPSSLGSSGPKSGPASASPRTGVPKSGGRRGIHSRTLSTNTILYNPQLQPLSQASSTDHEKKSQPRSRPLSSKTTEVESPTPVGTRSPRRSVYHASSSARPRPILAPRDQLATSRAGLAIDTRARPPAVRRLSSIDTSVASDSMLLAADDPNAGVPSSFQTQMAMAMMKEGRGTRVGDSGDRDRMGRLVLARMKTLEEGFADVVKEMRELKSATAPTSRLNSEGEASSGGGMLPTIEVAGKERRKSKPGQSAKKVSVRRPASRPRSVHGLTKLSTSPKDVKGKGKEIVADEEEESFPKKGSSL
jgi:hypothetical protein